MFDTDDIRKELDWESEEDLTPEAEETEENVYEYEEEKPRSRKKGKKGGKILVGAIAALVVILAAAALWINANYVVAGGLHDRDAQTLDLREKSISVKNYEKLSRELPGCDIRWGVPIRGERYDNQAAELVVPALKSEEIGLFAYFTALETLDVTGAELTVADFEALSAQLPDCRIRWSIPIGGARYDSAAGEITVFDFTAEEVELFALFDGLTTVDATGCHCYDEILALQALLPETKVLWNVELDGELLHQDVRELAVDNMNSLSKKLPYLPGLERVVVAAEVSAEEQLALASAYPGVLFDWDVNLCGGTYRSTAEEISFAGTALTAADLTEIEEKLPLFPQLNTLDLRDCGVSAEYVQKLCDNNPRLNVLWDFTLYGKSVSRTVKELDLSGITIENLAPLEEAIAWMPQLEKVIMSDCGLSNETMDALNQKYEDIRFVWTVYIRGYPLRTDAVAFFSSNFEDPVTEDLQVLRYCQDMLVMDLGHRNVTDLSFVEGTPHLKYLILTNSTAYDLSPLAGLKELEMLEMVDAAPMPLDLTPLLECESLVDLNICAYRHDGNGQEIADILCKMTGLERLWICTYQLDEQQRQQVLEALPNTEIYCSNDVTTCMGGLWR